MSISSGKTFDFIKPDAGLPKSKDPKIDLAEPGISLNNTIIRTTIILRTIMEISKSS
ncbi:hypothetical protein LEP1GSC043_2552 [Leptospira weilii str. Ecochallenge]|uniref:Uncharacterized protein n=1 Tax=Leptospira weilii str. Ecochallenge TaxID=1049986 RepID=N1U2E2_9LEPT|nr:hypothetical protein LEP1GSC043_2552 [Leptospira weilii str. Ecochallenge]